MAKMARKGFGQVEPNHLSAQRTAQIYAQLPAKSDIALLENGQYVKYDYANNEVNFTGAGEWMMVFNEVKLYDDAWRETYKDYAMEVANAADKEIYPRVIKVNVGDIYTTNCLYQANTTGSASVDCEAAEGDIAVGAKLTPNATGYLEKTSETTGMLFQVVKKYTLADGQTAVKVMRIQ